MGCPYFGNDDNALDYLCAAFELTPPPAGATRNRLSAAFAAAGIALTYSGSDRNGIDALYDALAAELTYQLDALLPEIQALFATSLRPVMSNGDQTATVTLDGSLVESTEYRAIPAGLQAGTANRLDAGVATVGNVMFSVTLPAATNAGESQAYDVSVLIGSAALAPVGFLTLTRTTAGDLVYQAVIGANSATDTLASVPATMGFAFNGPAGTVSVVIGGVTVLADVPYTPQHIMTILAITQPAGLATGDGAAIVASLSHTLPVVAPP